MSTVRPPEVAYRMKHHEEFDISLARSSLAESLFSYINQRAVSHPEDADSILILACDNKTSGWWMCHEATDIKYAASSVSRLDSIGFWKFIPSKK